MTTRKQRREMVKGIPLPFSVQYRIGEPPFGFEAYMKVDSPNARRRFTEHANSENEYHIAKTANGN